eukprot:CAMPEP_0185253996 /NCGR_PEP_ID=MMETSP1359-20130426/2609_1 /TAXON_ID=552665 /ORGANISM="Bigelowiella longifila, Strain CCMP242" /LENGTH=367 /DNA_ID=CAMNT_0027836543 /DNA_START=270 /DNA_END=1373 /DNA_ORIENTATION=+
MHIYISATIKYRDVYECLQEKRKAAVVGALTQFGFMPLIGYFYANVFDLKDTNAIGLILIACAPGGVTSNLITYWADGDLSLSITMSSVSTILAFAMLPLLIEIYINTTFTSSEINIPYEWIVISLLLLIVPCCIGVYIKAKNEVWAKRMEKSGSILGILALILALAWGIYKDSRLFKQPFGLWWSASTLQLLGTTFSYLTAWCMGFTSQPRRTIAIEAGIQNSTLIIALISNSFSDESQREEVLVPTFMYSIAWFFNTPLTLVVLRMLSSREDSSHGTEGGLEKKTIEDGTMLQTDTGIHNLSSKLSDLAMLERNVSKGEANISKGEITDLKIGVADLGSGKSTRSARSRKKSTATVGGDDSPVNI